MPVVVKAAEPELVSEVRVQIGKDWTHHRFGKPVERKVAVEWAQKHLNALAVEHLK